jgi:hypothetical protein
VITPASPPEEVHRIWRAAWWPVAQAVAATGADCMVLDPDADCDEDFHDGDVLHGVITVRAHVGLGWVLIVNETESDTEDS